MLFDDLHFFSGEVLCILVFIPGTLSKTEQGGEPGPGTAHRAPRRGDCKGET